jgi:hypothetical protein
MPSSHTRDAGPAGFSFTHNCELSNRLVSVAMKELEVLDFTERILSLLDTTRYSATYKLATLVALIDLAAEQTAAEEPKEQFLSGLEIGRRVLRLYWPQTAPYAPSSDALLRASDPVLRYRARRTFLRNWLSGDRNITSRLERALRTRPLRILHSGTHSLQFGCGNRVCNSKRLTFRGFANC